MSFIYTCIQLFDKIQVHVLCLCANIKDIHLFDMIQVHVLCLGANIRGVPDAMEACMAM